MLYAIHVHPHDIRDEGAERVVRNIVELAKIKTIIAEAVSLEERHPYPSGVLPHNPKHSVFVSKATLEVPLADNVFAGSPVRPKASEPVLAGLPAFLELSLMWRRPLVLSWMAEQM